MDSEEQNPVTNNTIFNVGSLSKGVAALTVLNLVRQGKIDLNADINEQLVSWKLPENDFTKEAKVTPLLLMNHSGGIMYSPPYSYLPENLPTLLQVLNGENPARSRPAVADKIPGTVYQYSNAGYSILQQLSIDVTGVTYPDLTNKIVFQPLEMFSSTFAQPLPSEWLPVACAGHSSDGRALAVKRFVYPHMSAGGLWTTSSDYAKYIIELQKAYNGQSDKIISRELAQQMLSPHVSKQYGLGVFMRENEGEINYFGHMGDNRGFFAGFISHLTDGYGAVVFTNSQNGAPLIREIFNGIANVYEWKKYLPAEINTVMLDNKQLLQYSGRYFLGTDNSFEIKVQNNQLHINRFDNAQLYHVGDGKFVTKFRKGYLQFIKDPNEKSTSVIYYFSDELGRFLREPLTCSRIAPDVKLPVELLNEGKISEAVNMYRKLKLENPTDFTVSEDRFNRLGYDYLQKNELEKALVIFKLNVEFYPESANCYDSLGEAFMKNGNKEAAIVNYNKSLKLNPNNSNAVAALKKLEKDNTIMKIIWKISTH